VFVVGWRGTGAGVTAPPIVSERLTALPAGFVSAGEDAVEAVIVSVPFPVTVALTRTVVVSPAGKKSSGQVTVVPEALQPGPRWTFDPPPQRLSVVTDA